MTGTTNYAWPLIAESQSQKFQTHNDALEAIDSVVYGLSSSSGLTAINAGTGITVSVDSPPTTVTISADTSVLATHAYVTGLGYGTGSVTSVAMTVPGILSVAGSPVTTTGTLAVSLATQTANLVFAGPTTGAAATPTFRALVAADLPAGATGTVTSVALTVPADLSVAGSPVTTSGTLAITRTTQNANLVMAGPATGAAATPAYRALVAADIPVQPYVVSGFYSGVPGNAQLLLVHQAAMAFTFPANFGTSTSGAASKAGCTINATASTVISVDRCLAASDPTSGGNWTQIGTLTIGVGGHAATLATASGTSKAIALGDFLRAVGPATADSTAANIFMTLAGDR